MKPRFLGLAAAGACLLLAMAAAGCGGGEDEVPVPTSVPLTPSTPGALATVEPDAALVQYDSPEGGYSVGYPEGWEQLEALSGPDFAVFDWTLEGEAMAQLTIRCKRGADQTVEDLIQQDSRIAAQVGGAPLSGPVPVEFAGTTGRLVTYARNVGGLEIEQIAAYTVAGECGWRIGLDAYGGGILDSYMPLFERILDSFQLD